MSRCKMRLNFRNSFRWSAITGTYLNDFPRLADIVSNAQAVPNVWIYVKAEAAHRPTGDGQEQAGFLGLEVSNEGGDYGLCGKIW